MFFHVCEAVAEIAYIGYSDIVRILFMVPLYAIISLASYFWWVSSEFCVSSAAFRTEI